MLKTQNTNGMPAFLQNLPSAQPLLGIPPEALSPLRFMGSGIPSPLLHLDVPPNLGLAMKPLGFLDGVLNTLASQQRDFPPLANIANGTAFQQADDLQVGGE